MGDTTDKIIDYYERVRTDDPNAPAFPFSREYDDVPWDAKVQMLRYSYHHEQRKDLLKRTTRPVQASTSADDEDLTVVQVISLAAAVIGAAGVIVIFLGTFIFLSFATLLGYDGRNAVDWERIWAGAMPLFALVALLGILGCAITYRDDEEHP